MHHFWRPFGWENQGRWTVQKKEGGKASGWAPEIKPKHRKSLLNGRQQGGAFGAAPRGRRFAPPPWGSCRLEFGKDFLCFGLISGAHPEAFPHPFFGTVHLPWSSQRMPLERRLANLRRCRILEVCRHFHPISLPSHRTTRQLGSPPNFFQTKKLWVPTFPEKV